MVAPDFLADAARSHVEGLLGGHPVREDDGASGAGDYAFMGETRDHVRIIEGVSAAGRQPRDRIPMRTGSSRMAGRSFDLNQKVTQNTQGTPAC